jgi:anti-sigma regulatory factor (Ser/Thr protein kinase)
VSSSEKPARLSLVPGLSEAQAHDPVALHRFGSSRRVEVHGPLPEVADAAYRAVLVALGEEPDEVVCDLSGVTGPLPPECVSVLASIGAEVQEWRGSPVGVVCPNGVLLQRLAQHPDAEHLVLAARRGAVLTRLADSPPRTVRRTPLPPEARSAGAARQLVAEACMDWDCGIQLEAATLIVSEMVTNALLHAGTMLELSVARCDHRLRLAVGDGGARRPQAQPMDTSRVTGRGMLLVAAFSRSWGVLPTADGGKVVWAVVEV